MNKKRCSVLLGWMLAIVMVFSVIPGYSFAQDIEKGDAPEVVTEDAKEAALDGIGKDATEATPADEAKEEPVNAPSAEEETITPSAEEEALPIVEGDEDALPDEEDITTAAGNEYTITLDMNGSYWEVWDEATGDTVQKPSIKLALSAGQTYDFYEIESEARNQGCDYLNELPTDQNKIFLGFTTVKNDISTLVLSEYHFPAGDNDSIIFDEYEVKQNQTLYAYWEKVCTITWSGNGHKIFDEWHYDDEGNETREYLESYERKIPFGTILYNLYVENESPAEGIVLYGFTSKKNDKSTLVTSRFSTDEDIVPFIVERDQTLYAYWEKACTITWHGNGYQIFEQYGFDDEGNESIEKLESVKEVVPIGTTLERPYFENKTPVSGKILLGFTTKKNDKSTLVESDYLFPDETEGIKNINTVAKQDQTLYAYWEDAHTITWNGNGHQIQRWDMERPADVYKEIMPVGTLAFYLDDDDLRGMDPAKEVFVGWTSKKNDRNAFKFNKQKREDWVFEVKGDETLYAYYAEPVKLTLNYTEGHSDDESKVKKQVIQVAKGMECSLPSWAVHDEKPTRIVFDGWAYDREGKQIIEPKLTPNPEIEDSYYVEYLLTIDKDTEVFAIFKEEFRITFISTNPNLTLREYYDFEKYNSVNQVTQSYLEGYILYAPLYDLKDPSQSAALTFSTDKEGKNPIDLYSMTATKDMTIYVNTVPAYKITFDGNGGKIYGLNSIEQTVEKGKSVEIADKDVTHTDSSMVFLGWSTDKNAKTGTKKVTPTKDTTYYAIWQKKTEDVAPVYRLYNPKTGEHLFTTDENEMKVLSSSRYKWKYEGVAWYSPKTGSGVYRLFNPKTGQHLYTVDLNEVNALTTKWGWRKDFNGKPLFYSGGSVSIYRVFNPRNRVGSHHWTTDQNEYKVLPKYGWNQEGVKFYAVRKGNF